tara:strand:- start:983 stop:1198 length:216 start_codon:yes stop_codon:yes gene_type:complete
MNRRYELILIKDIKKEYKTLRIGVEMDTLSIIDLFSDAESILFARSKSTFGNYVFVDSASFNFKFKELENY